MMMNPSWLEAAALRSEEEDWTLGQVFGKYRKLEERSAEELAAELGCTPEVLRWLSLCRRPEGDQLTEQVREIVERFAVDAHRLITVLRRVDVLDALSIRPAGEAGNDEGSLVLAARDRSSDDETSS